LKPNILHNKQATIMVIKFWVEGWEGRRTKYTVGFGVSKQGTTPPVFVMVLPATTAIAQ